jgi:hypothetical protein
MREPGSRGSPQTRSAATLMRRKSVAAPAGCSRFNSPKWTVIRGGSEFHELAAGAASALHCHAAASTSSAILIDPSTLPVM